ncbi:hypothetical protein [Photorhabdus khanii]|uniref:Uncharacterized protein n=1 Tax=Photorhabdus khanii subsp. guanajuatensis TaxID=2100166 RepID=A0A4R4K312_9GAMM|nr:hypothetical protein [Photorhabdus khanii]TDB61698.1 hypothetical protein C5467_04230 [Photorhabdus khanii subsp. guanajuatensis]
MSSKKRISIGPLQTVEIYSNSNIVMPKIVPTAIIKNRSIAPIKAINYWAGLIGDYQQYSYVDIYLGEVKMLVRPTGLIYRYKMVVSNLSSTETAEIDFVLDFILRDPELPSKKILLTDPHGLEIYNSGNAVLPTEFSDAIIKNNSFANIRAINYWAGPFGSYNMYTYLDVNAGNTDILASPPNVVNFYKIVVYNISSNVQNAEFEVISHLWSVGE